MLYKKNNDDFASRVLPGKKTISKPEDHKDVDKSQIITHTPGVKELHKNREESSKLGDSLIPNANGSTVEIVKAENMASGGPESIGRAEKGPWQRAARSPISGQYRRRVLTKDGREKWEYYKTKSNQYKGREPVGGGWAQVGKEEHGGYRRAVKKEESVDGDNNTEKKEVTPGSSSQKTQYEYQYPSKEHAEAARKYHGGKLFSSNEDEAREHLEHLHGARQALKNFSTNKTFKSFGYGIIVIEDNCKY